MGTSDFHSRCKLPPDSLPANWRGVDASYRTDKGAVNPNSLSMRANSCAAIIECPPNEKKSSSGRTEERFRTLRKRSCKGSSKGSSPSNEIMVQASALGGINSKEEFRDEAVTAPSLVE